MSKQIDTRFQKIRNWAHEKGIYESGDPKTQVLKLMEEVGELAKAILKRDHDEVYDAIGDCTVVLTNVAHLYEMDRVKRGEIKAEDVLTIETCINGSYEVISARRGKMINGTFVKDA